MAQTSTEAAPGQAPSIHYIPALDGLRGIAVCAVILFHAMWLTGGWAGVDVFFVLSGFLITGNLRREADTTGRIRFGRFYMRRILRLTPALWAVLAAVLAIVPFRSHPDNTFHAVVLGATYLMNWNRAFAWWPDDLLDHTWSLAMEEQFYLLWPVLFVLVGKQRPVAWLGAILTAIVAWRLALCWTGAPYWRTYNAFDTHADGLLLGCILALVDLPPGVLRAARALAIVPIVGLGLVMIGLPVESIVAQSIGLSVTAGLSAWLILVATGPGRVAGWLAARPLVFLGKISYGLYLWHFPIFILLRSKVPPVLVPALIVASVVMAVLSHILVERPFLRLKARWEPDGTPERRQPLTVVRAA